MVSKSHYLILFSIPKTESIFAIGHNWGSPHDTFMESRYNRRGKCGPEDEEGGKFLMWPYSVSGAHVNNFVIILLFGFC